MGPYQKHGIAVLGAELEADVDQIRLLLQVSLVEKSTYMHGTDQDLPIALPVFREGG